MTTVKKTITVPADLVTAAEEFSGSSFSAYMTEALRHKVAADRLKNFVALDIVERGEIPQADIDVVDAELEALERGTPEQDSP